MRIQRVQGDLDGGFAQLQPVAAPYAGSLHFASFGVRGRTSSGGGIGFRVVVGRLFCRFLQAA